MANERQVEIKVDISKRLRAIADNIPNLSRVVDVGTDHALLSIYLVNEGIATRVIASDVADGPIEAARVNVRRFGLDAVIEVRRGNGLATVSPGEVDTIVLAGMGGGLAARILRDGHTVVARARQVIVQPMNDADATRHCFYDMGLHLVSEQVVREEDRLYDVLFANIPSGREEHSIDVYAPYVDDPLWLEIAFLLGPINLQQPTPEFLDKVAQELERWNKVSSGLSKSTQAGLEAKRSALQQRLARLSTWLSAVKEQ